MQITLLILIPLIAGIGIGWLTKRILAKPKLAPRPVPIKDPNIYKR